MDKSMMCVATFLGDTVGHHHRMPIAVTLVEGHQSRLVGGDGGSSSGR